MPSVPVASRRGDIDRQAASEQLDCQSVVRNRNSAFLRCLCSPRNHSSAASLVPTLRVGTPPERSATTHVLSTRHDSFPHTSRPTVNSLTSTPICVNHPHPRINSPFFAPSLLRV